MSGETAIFAERNIQLVEKMEELQAIKQRFEIIGNNEGLNRAIDVARQVAPTDLSVLITGESGVGKEIFPRIIPDNLESLLDRL